MPLLNRSLFRSADRAQRDPGRKRRSTGKTEEWTGVSAYGDQTRSIGGKYGQEKLQVPSCKAKASSAIPGKAQCQARNDKPHSHSHSPLALTTHTHHSQMHE